MDTAGGWGVTVRAFLHDTGHLGAVLADTGFEVVARVDRQPRAGEATGQGFLIGRRR